MSFYFLFFFFNDTATTEIYTLSLHDALPISSGLCCTSRFSSWCLSATRLAWLSAWLLRSEEHTSELQSRLHLVCRLLLEKKKHNIFIDFLIFKNKKKKKNKK